LNNKKIFLVTNIPTPYRIPLFNELHRQLEQLGIKLKIIFGARGYSRRKWKIDLSQRLFDYQILSSGKIIFFDNEKTIFTYRGLLRAINRENPAVIITSGFSIATTILWLRSFFKKTNYIIWSGAIERKDKPDSLVRKIQRRLLVKKAAGFIAYGTMAKHHLISLGAPPEKIYIAINTVDTEFFLNKIAENKYRDQNRKKTLLYIGHFVKRKRVDLLLYMAKLLLKTRNDFVLRLVGDGPEKEKLKHLADELNISEYVSFEGFKQKKEIIEYLRVADCFLFPTSFDIWGLVLVEAMAAGVPCIASIYAGATHDLIRDGINGIAANFTQREKIVEKIDWLLDNPERAKIIGKNASNFIGEKVNLKRSAAGFLDAVMRI